MVVRIQSVHKTHLNILFHFCDRDPRCYVFQHWKTSLCVMKLNFKSRRYDVLRVLAVREMLAAYSHVLTRKIPVRCVFVQGAEPSLALGWIPGYSIENDTASSGDLCLALRIILAAGDTACIRHYYYDSVRTP